VCVDPAGPRDQQLVAMVEPQPDYDIFEGLSKDETNRAMDHSGLLPFDDTDLGRLCASFQDYIVNFDNIDDGINEGYNKQHHGARGHTAGTTPAVNSEYNDNMLFDTSSGLAGPHPQAARLLGAAAPDQTTQAPWTHPSAPQPTQPGTFTSLLNTDPTNSNYTQQPPSQPAMQQDPPPPPPPKRRALKAKAPATVKQLRPVARALAAKFPALKHHIPDPARIKRTQIKALLKHLLGGCDSPNPLPYPEASDFEGPHNPDQEPYYYLARLFSELLGKDISAEDMKECVQRTSGNPWLVAGEFNMPCALCSGQRRTVKEWLEFGAAQCQSALAACACCTRWWDAGSCRKLLHGTLRAHKLH
jgi:hypothetical protein